MAIALPGPSPAPPDHADLPDAAAPAVDAPVDPALLALDHDETPVASTSTDPLAKAPAELRDFLTSLLSQPVAAITAPVGRSRRSAAVLADRRIAAGDGADDDADFEMDVNKRPASEGGGDDDDRASDGYAPSRAASPVLQLGTPEPEDQTRKSPRRVSAGPGGTFTCTDHPPCAKTFYRQEHLARHVRGHTRDKPFVCHCGRKFSRLDNMRQRASSIDRFPLTAQTPTRSTPTTRRRTRRP